MPDLAAWEARARAGEPLAQLVLANAYVTGRYVPQSFEHALRLVRAACESNDAEALLYHAMLATLGLGRTQNVQEAYDLTARAAALGSERARKQLAVLSDAGGRFKIEDWRAPIHAVQHAGAPRIFTLKNFIPKAACDWLIVNTRPYQQPAMVLDQTHGGITKHTRTNSSAAIDPLETDLPSQLINVRIADAVGLPLTHQEPTSILFYKTGEEYKPHNDYFAGERLAMRAEEIAQIGQRIGTLLIYLNHDYQGGETAFPRLGARYKGQTGDALLFWSVAADGALEPNALHAGLPVASGEKWLLSKWLRAKPIPLNSDYLWGADEGAAKASPP